MRAGMENKNCPDEDRKRFEELFGHEPSVHVHSPGRANIIGEHTDYNDGLVFPFSIESRITVYAAPNGQNKVKLYGRAFEEAAEFDLKELKRTKHWSDYVKGVLHELNRRKLSVKGFDAYFGGDLPIASGLSSSAALELAVCRTCSLLGGFELDAVEEIKLCRQAENQFVGVSCGIMDQFAIRMGQEHHGVFIDCRSLNFELVPIPSDELVFVITYSGVKRGLGATAYRERQMQCQKGVQFFSGINKSLHSLRDVSEGFLQTGRDNLDPIIYRRCRHVVTENHRVEMAVGALRQPDMSFFGELMNISHESLKSDYEVSCKELDLLVDLARQAPGVLGSRMTGAGFGGCTITLVQRTWVEEFKHRVGPTYTRSTGLTPEFLITHASRGVWGERL
jgi:galactokinase